MPDEDPKRAERRAKAKQWARKTWPIMVVSAAVLIPIELARAVIRFTQGAWPRGLYDLVFIGVVAFMLYRQWLLRSD